MSSKIKVDTIENVAGSGNVSLGSGHNLVVPGNQTVGGTLGVTGASTLTGDTQVTGNLGVGAAPERKFHVEGNGAEFSLVDTGKPTDKKTINIFIDANGKGNIRMLNDAQSAGNAAITIGGTNPHTAPIVTLGYQPSFFAGWTTTSNAGGYGSVQYGNAFGTVGWNIGSGWDSAGTFTAPVAGKYLVYLAMSFTSGANRIHAGFYINGGGGTTSQGNSGGDPWLQTGRGNDGSSDQDHVFVSKVFNLNANDTLKPVYLIFDNDNNSQIYQHRTYVGGYLLG